MASDSYRKAYLMPIIGHACKMAYGWALGESANSVLAMEAWNMAKKTFERLGIACEGMIMHHDQDSVYTGHMWTGQLLLKDKVRFHMRWMELRTIQRWSPSMVISNRRATLYSWMLVICKS